LIHALLCAQFCITDRMKSIDTGLLFLFTWRVSHLVLWNPLFHHSNQKIT
jgi:hypothetical protein